MLQIITKLILKFISPNTRSTCSVTEWISRLNHEFGYDTMENDALEITTSCMSNKVFNSFWCLLWKETYIDITECGMNCSRIGNRRRTNGVPNCCCCNRLFFARRAFVKDIAVARFVPCIDPSEDESKVVDGLTLAPSE